MTCAELIKDLADELEAYIRHEYDGILQYPSVRRKFDRDMALVREAQKWLHEFNET